MLVSSTASSFSYKATETLLAFRGFNDAINSFPDEGWVSIINDGPSTVSIYINPPSNAKHIGGMEAGPRNRSGILCAKASLLLQVSLGSVYIVQTW